MFAPILRRVLQACRCGIARRDVAAEVIFSPDWATNRRAVQ